MEHFFLSDDPLHPATRVSHTSDSLISPSPAASACEYISLNSYVLVGFRPSTSPSTLFGGRGGVHTVRERGVWCGKWAVGRRARWAQSERVWRWWRE